MSPRPPAERSLAFRHPEVATEWNLEKNKDLSPEDVFSGSSKKAWWVCEKGHEWQAAISSRARGNGCPYCSGNKVSLDNCLATLRPDLANEWHKTKNGGLSPRGFTISSSKKVWWKCNKGHEWEAAIFSRSRRKGGAGCPFCCGLFLTAENSLASVYPNLTKEWHPTRNLPLTPENTSARSGKKVWWVCSKKHEWQAVLYHRASGSGCPYCTNRLASEQNSLASKFPKLAMQWCSEKNAPLKPQEVVFGSHKKVWWECGRGHTWKSAIVERTQGSGCPYCSNQTSKPELRLFAEISEIIGAVSSRKKIAGYELDILLDDYGIGIEYDGRWYHRDKHQKDLHKNTELGNHGIKVVRVRESPLKPLSELDVICNAQRLRKTTIDQLLKNLSSDLNANDLANSQAYLKKSRFQSTPSYKKLISYLPGPPPSESLSVMHPQLKDEWHRDKNSPLSSDNFSPGSHAEVWWICKKGHEWKARIAHRANGVGCPFCSNQKVCADNNLEVRNPELAKEWANDKNAPLTPGDVVFGSRKKVWWRCKKGHEYQAMIMSRSRGTGCPYCAGKLISKDNNLAAVNPELAREWHKTKNGQLRPKDVTPGSDKKVWWKCSEKHEWKASLYHRKNGKGCPYCSGNLATRTNNFAVVYPKLAKEWHATKNDQLVPQDVKPGSGKKVWWTCPDGHEYQKTIYHRCLRGQGCPVCFKLSSRNMRQ